MAGAVDVDPQAARLPEPLRERPPGDRYCDLVLAGGVASGVVYPWALLELARHFRFRNLGGTSVGALAAALAAACEYGRRHGFDEGFEVLRRLPVKLADRPEGQHRSAGGRADRTQLLALFEPTPQGERLFKLLLQALDHFYANPGTATPGPAPASSPPAHEKDPATRRRGWQVLWQLRHSMASAYALGVPLGCALAAALAAGFAGLLWMLVQGTALDARWSNPLCWTVLLGGLAGLAGLACAGWRLWQSVLLDLREGLAKQELGLCKGEALVRWLHEGVQQAAGLSKDAAPLTFEDLWRAPLTPGGVRPDLGPGGVPLERSIHLEMVTTNVTHGRPYRLPLADPDARLFFRREEWQGFLPPRVLDALCEASQAYRPKTLRDPAEAVVVSPDDGSETRHDDLLELPGARMPIVVAARLSLSYPLLFACPPLYAIDCQEPEVNLRRLRRCRFTDGGLCSNFPVHFFDSAMPRWPTFGIFLGERDPGWQDQPVWLPAHAGQGRGDAWTRFEASDPPPERHRTGRHWRAPASPLNALKPGRAGPGVGVLLGFLWAGFVAAKDWRDHSTKRMPHVSRRVVRVGLLPGEGELNIGMSASVILRMAETYGTAAGQALCAAYAPASPVAAPTQAWREHLWQRQDVLLSGLRDLFRQFDRAANSSGHTVALRQLIEQARHTPPIDQPSDQRTLTDAQALALRQLVDALEALQVSLLQLPPLPHASRPAPELRLRPPL